MRKGEFAKFVDIFAPQTCLSCGATGGIFCWSCSRSLGRVEPVRGEVDLGFSQVPGFAGSIYSETVRDCLVGVKRTGAHELYRPLIPVAARSVEQMIRSMDPRRPVAFVSVSSGAKTRRGFGGDLVRSLLVDAIEYLRVQDRLPAAAKIEFHDHLKPRRSKQSQKFQSSKGRLSNIHGAFRATPGSIECAITSHVVFDDIMTTGSTVREVARALQSVGIDVKAVVSVAARPRALGCPVTR